jgi:hypothetical protein
MKKIWYTYTKEDYSFVKNNEIMSFSGKLMGLIFTILGEVSQFQKSNDSCFPSYTECRLRMIITIIIGHEYKGGIFWRASVQREEKGQRGDWD